MKKYQILLLLCISFSQDQPDSTKFVLTTSNGLEILIIDYKIDEKVINITRDGENWGKHPINQIKSIKDASGNILWNGTGIHIKSPNADNNVGIKIEQDKNEGNGISLSESNFEFLDKWDTFSIAYGANQYQSASFIRGNYIGGLGFIHVKIDAEFTDTYTDWYNNTETNTSTSEMRINVFMPKFGYRMPLKSIKKINTFAQLEGYMIIPFAKINSGQGSSDIENEIEDILDLFGLKVSYGVNYSFTDQLSLSSEVGLNMIFNNYDSTTGDEYNTYRTELSTRIGTSFTKISLNFNK